MLSILCFCMPKATYSKGKKVTQGIFFEGDLDFEKQPIGEGILHFYSFDPSKTTTNKSNEFFTISGTFSRNAIKNAELRWGKTIIRGNFSYSLRKDGLEQNLLSLTFDSIMFDTPTFKLDYYESSDETLILSIGYKTRSIQDATIRVFDKKEYHKYEGDPKRETYDDYKMKQIKEITSIFGTSPVLYQRLYMFYVLSNELRISSKPADVVVTENKHMFFFQRDRDSDEIVGGTYACSNERIDFYSRPKFWLRKVHLVSNHNITYDGEFGGEYFAYNYKHGKVGVTKIKITYPDGSTFEGKVTANYLNQDDANIGLDFYKLLKESDHDTLKPIEGIFTSADGKTTNINYE